MSTRTRWGFDRKTARQRRPDKLVRPIASAAPARWPYRDHRTLAEVDGELQALKAKVEQLEQRTAAKNKGYRAKAGDEAAGPEQASACPAMEPVSRSAAGRSAAAASEPMDVTAGETATAPKRLQEKIPIAGIRSEMDRRAEQVRAIVETASAAAAPAEDGKVWCEGCDARVPAWFGKDCIAGNCSLRAAA